jgi:hypothetical protein
MMPRHNLTEVLTVDVGSWAVEKVMIILCPTVLTIVLVNMASLTMVFTPH